MKTIVGLGNPGDEYVKTRHNVGRAIVETLGKHLGNSSFEEKGAYFGRVTTGTLAKEKTLFLLPDTFMNKSGKSVASAKPKPKDLIIVHDDSDLPLGTFKISFGRNSGGHKGVESVMRAIKSKDFWRVRIGVQKKKRVEAQKLVLQKFVPAEDRVVKKIEKEISKLLDAPLFVTTRRV